MTRETSTPGRPEDPEQVRREGLRRLQLVEAIKLDAPPLPCEVEPIRRRPGALRVAGIRARHTPTTVASPPTFLTSAFPASGSGDLHPATPSPPSLIHSARTPAATRAGSPGRLD